jgi:hypothetical protein
MLKDLEGYTAFDLYNSTVEDTKPPHSPSGEHGFADLYTWGANRFVNSHIFPDSILLVMYILHLLGMPHSAWVTTKTARILIKSTYDHQRQPRTRLSSCLGSYHYK